MSGPSPVVIVGAGTAGLVAALALARQGRPSTLLERAPRLGEIGAGLQLSPNALRVMQALGLADALRARAVEADAVRLRDGRTNRLLARVPVASPGGPGYVSLRRADLQGVLLDAARAEPLVALRLGCPLRGVDAGSKRPVAELEDGSRLPCDLLVAADGVHSAVARALNLEAARPTGTLALRFAVPPETMPPEAADGIQAWLGPARHAVFYPVRGAMPGNLVLVVPASEAEPGAMAAFSSWNETLRALISGSSFLGSWPILDVPDGARPSRPNLVFIGDAAHAMPPYAAQGAAMAIEDGFVLAHWLASGVPDPLARYEEARAERLRRVRQRVGFHRFVYHLPRPLSFGRDLVLAASPQHRLRNGLAWLYDWEPPAVSPAPRHG